NRSPKVLTSASSPQRASATCSSIEISSRPGHTRRTATCRTHGSFSTLARTSARSAAKKLPEMRGSAASSSARLVFWKSPLRSTRVSGKCCGSSTQYSAPKQSASTAIPETMPARSVTLADMRPLQDLHAQVFVRDAHCARRHRHQRVIGHAGRGIHFEQVGPSALVEHEIDAAPAAAAERTECLEADCLQLLFLLLRHSARDEVARVVRDVLRLVVVELARRLDADVRQHPLAEDRRGELR